MAPIKGKEVSSTTCRYRERLSAALNEWKDIRGCRFRTVRSNCSCEARAERSGCGNTAPDGPGRGTDRQARVSSESLTSQKRASVRFGEPE